MKTPKITQTPQQTAPAHYIEGPPTLHQTPPKGWDRVFVPTPPGQLPEFSKLPRPRERCPFSGASRSWLLEHGELGHFKLVRVRKAGAVRGAVFVHVPSLLAFLRTEMEKQTGETQERKAKVAS